MPRMSNADEATAKKLPTVEALVKAFEEGNATKLTTEERQYVVSWLRIARPTMTQAQMARLLCVTAETIRRDVAGLDSSMAESMQAIDVGLVIAQYGAQLNKAIENIHKSIEIMHETEKGRTTATYLQFVRAPSELFQGWLKTMKDIGLIGEDGHGAQEEYSWKTITSKDGVVTSEAVHKINKAIETVKSRNTAFEPGVHKAPEQIEGEVATENTQSDSDTTIN